jgi:hypothetical protein
LLVLLALLARLARLTPPALRVLGHVSRRGSRAPLCSNLGGEAVRAVKDASRMLMQDCPAGRQRKCAAILDVHVRAVRTDNVHSRAETEQMLLNR